MNKLPTVLVCSCCKVVIPREKWTQKHTNKQINRAVMVCSKCYGDSPHGERYIDPANLHPTHAQSPVDDATKRA